MHAERFIKAPGWACAQAWMAVLAVSSLGVSGAMAADDDFPYPHAIPANAAEALKVIGDALTREKIEEVTFITVTTSSGEMKTFAVENSATQEFTLDVSGGDIRVPKVQDGTGTLAPLPEGARILIIHNPLVQCNPNLGGSRNCTSNSG